MQVFLNCVSFGEECMTMKVASYLTLVRVRAQGNQEECAFLLVKSVHDTGLKCGSQIFIEWLVNV